MAAEKECLSSGPAWSARLLMGLAAEVRITCAALQDAAGKLLQALYLRGCHSMPGKTF